MSVTQLSAGDMVNVIPASASLGATVRTLSDESVVRFREEATRVADGIAAAHGCIAEVVFEVEYPVTVNDEAETAWVAEEVSGSARATDAWSSSTTRSCPARTSRYVLREVPGTYMMLGARRDDVPDEEQADNHSPYVGLRRLRPGRPGGTARAPGAAAAGARRWREPGTRGEAPPTVRGTEVVGGGVPGNQNHKPPTFIRPHRKEAVRSDESLVVSAGGRADATRRKVPPIGDTHCRAEESRLINDDQGGTA